MNQENLRAQFLIPAQTTIRQAMSKIDSNVKGIVLVVNEKTQLIGTITDGDIRRIILMEGDLDGSVEELLFKKKDSAYSTPITAAKGTSQASLLNLMRKHHVRHIPILDETGGVVDLVTLEDLCGSELRLEALIMAGGYGKRLGPLTDKTPKPMLLVGQDPILKLMIQRLRKAGITRVNIATHHQSEKITRHFGDGKDLGVNIQYFVEDSPLGTAGSLRFIRDLQQPLLIINGDIVTKVDFRAMLEFHQEQRADLTMGVQTYDVQISYGVVETQGVYVKKITEKPKHTYLVNAGIYLIEPSALHFIPKDQRFDMTDLIQKLLDGKRPVASFPIREYWLDIGNPDDYKRAQNYTQKGRL